MLCLLYWHLWWWMLHPDYFLSQYSVGVIVICFHEQGKLRLNCSDLLNVSSLERDNAELHSKLWMSDETTVSDTWYLKQEKHFPTTDPEAEGVFHIRKQLITDFCHLFITNTSAYLWHFSKLLACAITSVLRTALFPGKHYFILKICSFFFWNVKMILWFLIYVFNLTS